MSSQPILKTPLELQLQKINLAKFEHYQNLSLGYNLLKLLYRILNTLPNLATSSIFHTLFKQVLKSEQGQIIRNLPLFEDLSYLLWNNEHLSLDIREKTSFYRIVSNWIISFELRSGNLSSIYSQFELILEFMIKETKTPLQRLIMINQVFQDLKDLISAEFWQEPQAIKVEFSPEKFSLTKSTFNKQQTKQAQQNCSQQQLKAINIVLEILQILSNPVYHRIKNTLYKNCTYSRLLFPNVKQFIKKSIYFILRQGMLPTHIQNELTKIALIYLESLPIEESKDILNMLKHLMLSTSKAVRFALVVQYVEFYDYLEEMGYEQVIQQLEEIIYFRELIIGKRIVEENINERSNTLKNASICYNQVYVKAGTNKRIYFSNENREGVLKAEVLVQQNDINMKIIYLDSIKLEESEQNQSKYVFEAISKINQFQGTTTKSQKVYWSQQKATSKKLELKLQYLGLYCLQLDNNYSWLIPKNIKYRIQIYCPS